MLVDLTGAPAELLEFSSAPSSEVDLLIGSIEIRQEMVAWKPKNSLLQGLEKTLKWWEGELRANSNR